MIQDKNTDFNVTSTVQGEKIAMGIHADAMAHIMGVLTDLYSDPMLAILREYSTNALDAHVEAGQTRPIEVTTPSQLSPFFTVQDFGVGLTHDDIRAIYSQYGASTKRGTNEQVGMLGLGCKSALTYTNQFTLVGVKNGVRVTVAIGRDEDGAGSMTVVDTATTHEPNGVTVRVPAKLADAHAFEQKAREFFRFWKPGTVLVNGSEPQHVEGVKISDDLTVIESPQSYVVMGNVAYPVGQGRLNHGMGWGIGVVARVAIGSVNFTPSREALHYTPKTLATLRQIEQDFNFHSRGAIQRLVDEADDYPEALAVMVKWGQRLPSQVRQSSYTFKGKTLPSQIKHHGMTTTARSGKLSSHSTQGAIQAQVYGDTLFVQGYDAASFTAGQKKKMLKFCDDAGMSHIRHFALLPGKLTADEKVWIKDEQIVQWPTIKAIKLPRTVKQGTWRLQGSFDCYVAGTFTSEVPAQDVYDTDDDELFYYQGNRHDARYYAAALRSIQPDATLVCLPANRLEKFKRDLPHAQEVSSILRARWTKFVATVPANQRFAFTVQNKGCGDLKKLDPEKVTDPDLKRAIQACKTDLSGLDAKIEKWQGIGNAADLYVKYDNPLYKYPLFDYPYMYGTPNAAQRKQIAHLYLYMNAAYAAESDNGQSA